MWISLICLPQVEPAHAKVLNWPGSQRRIEIRLIRAGLIF